MRSGVNTAPNMSLSTILQEIGPWSPGVWKLPASRIYAQQLTWLSAHTHCCLTGTWAKENWSATLQITLQISRRRRGTRDGLGSAVFGRNFHLSITSGGLACESGAAHVAGKCKSLADMLPCRRCKSGPSQSEWKANPPLLVLWCRFYNSFKIQEQIFAACIPLKISINLYDVFFFNHLIV